MQGDFNLDLLKSESHQETKNFLNALNSYSSSLKFFNQPELQIILQHLLITYFSTH